MEPQDREETYLAAAAGDSVELPACPWNRKEAYLADIGDRIDGIEEDVETLKNNPDVVDIVDTYADLQAYDKTKLTDNDVIRVLNDETHDGESTYYRYSAATQTFTYIGTTKQYTDFVGTDGTTTGEAGLVPAPATTDAGKFLKADGTWDTAGSSVNVVQTTGTSTTDVMSQNAVTKMVFDTDTSNQISIGWKRNGNNKIWIGNSLANNHSISDIGANGILIGKYGATSGVPSVGQDTIVISQDAWSTPASGAVVLGNNTSGNYQGSIRLGYGSSVSAVGQMDIGSTNTSYGYNSSNYRLLSGVYDGQSAHDAATKGQLDTAIINGGTTAPTTSTAGAVGTQYTYVDTTGTPTAHLCVCTEIDNTDPSNPVYTWSTLI